MLPRAHDDIIYITGEIKVTSSCILDVTQLQSLVLFPLPILSLLWEVCSVLLRIVQHKIFFIVGAVVILAVIGLLIFGIVMIKRGNSGGSGGGMNG